MTLDEMKEQKRQLGYTYEQIAMLSNVPLGTVQKVLGGVTKSPRYDTLRALELLFLSKKEAAGGMESADISAEPERKNFEHDFCEKKGGERLFGTIYENGLPSCLHQMIVCEIYSSFRSYFCKNSQKGIAMCGPLAISLDDGDKTVVQPDVLVLLGREKLQRGCLKGVPDLVVEVLSQSSKNIDSYLKPGKYEEAGVKEYWLVDPEEQKLMVYNFLIGGFPAIYSFSDQVPVSVLEGECSIDFAEIYQNIRFLYEEE